MTGKPYHKMPTSSWMLPGGNREKKQHLMSTQSYPMKSAIKKNLGGPLSSVFFSCLTPAQQDHVGYTPRLAGPGRDMWVSPSDILKGHVVLSPPYTSHLRQGLTHQGILEMGSAVEEKMQKKHEMDIAQALEEKEREMHFRVEAMIKEAVDADRRAHQLINDQILEKASSDLKTSYQEVLDTTMNQALVEGTLRLEEAVTKTKQEMEEQLCLAVASHADHLARQYEFHSAWSQSDLYEKYQEQLKNHQKNCSTAMENAEKKFNLELKKVIAKLEAQHINEILSRINFHKQIHREEKDAMEEAFNGWFMEHFQNEITKRDFHILDLENAIRDVETKCLRRENQIREIFRHFQKFINFALKEKPGQAEFLLNVQKELEGRDIIKDDKESEEEYIARLIIEYIVKDIDDQSKAEEAINIDKHVWNKYTIQNFRKKLAQEKIQNRLLQLVGEGSEHSVTKDHFQKSRESSMATMFNKSPSMIPVLQEVLDQIPQ